LVVFAVLFSADCQDIHGVCFQSSWAVVPVLRQSASHIHSSSVRFNQQ